MLKSVSRRRALGQIAAGAVALPLASLEVPCLSTMAPWQPWFFGRKGDPAKGFAQVRTGDRQ